MSRTAINDILAQTNLIRDMMYYQSKNDKQIVEELRIPYQTYYKYKRRIQDEDSKAWQAIHKDSAEYRASRLIQRLEECEQLAVSIRDDTRQDPRMRIDAGKTACEASANIFKVINEGPVFTVSLDETKVNKILPLPDK